MIASFDFKDALEAIFRSKNSIRQKPLECLRGKKIAVDVCSLFRYNISKLRKILDFETLLSDLQTNLREVDIDLRVISSGLEILDLESLYFLTRRSIQMSEKRHLLRTITQLMVEDKETHEKNFERFETLGKTIMMDSLWEFSVEKRYYATIDAALYKTKIPRARAIQLKENQMALWVERGVVDHVWAQAFPLWFEQINEVIVDIDFKEKTYEFLDFNALSDNYDCSRQKLRKAIFGAFLGCVIGANPTRHIKLNTKTLQTFFKNPDGYKNNCREQVNDMENKIQILLRQFDDDEINDSFCRDIASHLKLDEKTVCDLYAFYASCPTINQNNKVELFPKCCRSIPSSFRLNCSPNLPIVLFGRDFIEEELLGLLNFRTNFTAYFYYQNIKCPEVEFYYSVYFRESIQQLIWKAAISVGLAENYKCALSVGLRKPLVIEPNKCPLSLKYLEILCQTKSKFFAILSTLVSNINNNKQSPNFKITNNLTVSYIENLLLGNLLHNLKYVDIEKDKVFVLGAVLLSAGDSKFYEELIFLFELIRHEFLQPHQFSFHSTEDKDHDMPTDGNFFDAYVQKSIAFNPNCTKAQSLDENSESENINNRVNLETRRIYSETDKALNSDTLHTSISKTQSKFYVTVKEFQRDYVNSSKLALANLISEDILREAFENNALGYAALISRFFCFVSIGYYFMDQYDCDSYQFRECVFIIRKSLRFSLQCDLIALSSMPELSENTKLLEEVERILPFRKSYSPDAISVAKTILCQFLILRTLIKRKDPFSEIYKKSLQLDQLKQRFRMNFDFFELLQKAHQLFQTVKNMTKFMKVLNAGKDNGKIYENMHKASELFEDLLNFYLK